MKLDIITFSAVNQIKKVIPLLVYSYVLLLIFTDRSSNTGIHILQYSGLIVIITWFLVDLFTDNYKKIGSISLNNFGNCEIELNGIKKQFEINSILLYYGGYNGESHTMEAFITFSNARNGACNYLIINNFAYQIILHNKEDWNKIKSILNDLHTKVKTVECVIMRFPDFFKCLYDIGKKPFEKFVFTPKIAGQN